MVVRWIRVPVILMLGVAAVAAAAGSGSAVAGPRYSMLLQIVPAAADPVEPRSEHDPAQLYSVRLRVDNADEPVVPDFPTLELHAGEKRSRSVSNGSLTLSCEVAVDADGRHAAALVELSEAGVPVLTQRFAVWLPELGAGSH